MDSTKFRQSLQLVAWVLTSLVSHLLNWMVMTALGFLSFAIADRLIWFAEDGLMVKIGLALFVFQFLLCLVTALSLRLFMLFIVPDVVYSVTSLRGTVFYSLTRLHELCCLLCLNTFKSQPFILWYYRIAGAKLGLGVVLNSLNIDPCRFVRVGRGTFVGGDTKIIAHSFRGQGVVFRDVHIGESCALGLGCVVTRGSHVGDRAVLQSGTCVYGGNLEGGHRYTGSPARRVE